MVTLKVFKSRLNEGKYKNAGGAKKAIGKAQNITDEEKIKARKLVDKHFSAQTAAASAEA